MVKELREIQNNRLFEVIESWNGKMWSIPNLLKKINVTLPSNLELTQKGLRGLISKQLRYKVFRCRNCSDGKTKTYYIFKKCLPE